MSGSIKGADVSLSAVNGQVDENSGVAHAAQLVAFTEAAMTGDADALDAARSVLRVVLTPEAFVDTCAVIGAFNIVDRIADATGIPLDDNMAAMSQAVREELDLSRFASSANTPGAASLP